jgi:predicted nucleic acid-binding protein
MRYLLDSNTLIYSARPEPQFAALRTWIKHPEAAVSALAVVEVLGYHAISAADTLYFQALLRLVPQLPITQAFLQRAVLVRQQFRLKTPDALIVSTALEHGLELVTADRDFARVTGLVLIDPLSTS